MVYGKLGEEPEDTFVEKEKSVKEDLKLRPKQLLQQLGGNKFIAMVYQYIKFSS